MLTTDKEKRNRESIAKEHDHYDLERPDFGTFQTAIDRDCVGIYRTNAEIHADGGKAYNQFKNILEMEEELIDNNGQKFFEVPIPNSLNEISD